MPTSTYLVSSSWCSHRRCSAADLGRLRGAEPSTTEDRLASPLRNSTSVRADLKMRRTEARCPEDMRSRRAGDAQCDGDKGGPVAGTETRTSGSTLRSTPS